MRRNNGESSALPFLMYVLAVLIGTVFVGCVSAAEVETTVINANPTKYVCIRDWSEGPVFGDNSLVTTRKECEALSAAEPGQTYWVQFTEKVDSFIPVDDREWVVAPYWASNDRAIYDCGAACLAEQDRGSNLGRSYPEGIGRCEGPLTPVWGSSTKQWQFHTNADGIRGVVYCAFITPFGPAPVTSVPEAPEIALEYGTEAAQNCPLFLVWTFPETYEDGSPLPDDAAANLVGRIHLTDNIVADAIRGERSACLTGLPAGTYNVRMSTLFDGEASGLSNSIEVDIP